MQQVKSPYKADYLLAIRGILAFTVVFHHFKVSKYYNRIFDIEILSYLAPDGSYSVYGFFALSGYLMVKVFNRYTYKSGTVHFYYNRLARIAPLYYLAIVYTIVTSLHMPSDLAMNTDPKLLLNTAFFLANYKEMIMNPPLWSISTEVQFYILVPLLAFIFKPAKAKKLVTILVSLFILSIILRVLYLGMRSPELSLYTNLEVNMLFFLSGWFAFLLRDKLPKMSSSSALAIIASTIVLCWIVDINFVPTNFAGRMSSPLWYIIMPAFISIAFFFVLPSLDKKIQPEGRTSGWFMRVASSILTFLGITSFSAYVLHLPSTHVFEYFGTDYLSTLGVPHLAIFYFFCYIVYRIFEQPLYSIRIRNKQ